LRRPNIRLIQSASTAARRETARYLELGWLTIRELITGTPTP
jgi:hypothetical protein